MFKRFIFPFILGQILTFYTLSSMFDVSIADTKSWPSNLQNLMYLLCVLYTMMFSSMAHYCKQNDLRRKLEKEKVQTKKDFDNEKESMLKSIESLEKEKEKLLSHISSPSKNISYPYDLIDEVKKKTEMQELREMIESLKNKK